LALEETLNQVSLGGNHSFIQVGSQVQNLEIRRAFSVFQLTTILEEARHSLIKVEHDPLLLRGGPRDKRSISPKPGEKLPKRPQSCFTHLELILFLVDMTRNTDNVLYFDEGLRATTKLIRKLIQKRRRARPPWRLGHDPMEI
jgi:hypothetical protein